MKGIPNTETIWVTSVRSNGTKFYTTSKSARDMYYLYKEEDGVVTKISKAKNPLEFDKIIYKEKHHG